MKRFFVLALLALAVPIASWANSTSTFDKSGGIFTIGSNGIRSGFLYKNTFSGPLDWAATQRSSTDNVGVESYTLTGTVLGKVSHGTTYAD